METNNSCHGRRAVAMGQGPMDLARVCASVVAPIYASRRRLEGRSDDQSTRQATVQLVRRKHWISHLPHITLDIAICSSFLALGRMVRLWHAIRLQKRQRHH